MSDKPVFKNPANWALHPKEGCLLYFRIPLENGPVELWLEPTITVDELSELVLPQAMAHVQMLAEFNTKVEQFRKRKAKVVPATDVLDALAGLAAPTPEGE